jgi:Ca2+-binding EF-hand superfamily protein
MSVINSLDGLQSKDKKEQKDQIFKYVKSIWPKYDVNKKE